jgi:hypothetical protein
MTDAADLISLMAFTLGSIGQVVKDQSTLKEHSTKEQKHDEVKRIYEGYINAIIQLTKQTPMNER